MKLCNVILIKNMTGTGMVECTTMVEGNSGVTEEEKIARTQAPKLPEKRHYHSMIVMGQVFRLKGETKSW